MGNIIQPSFAGGEVSPSLAGRVDLAKYRVGAALLENFMVLPGGGVANRPGLKLIGLLLQQPVQALDMNSSHMREGDDDFWLAFDNYSYASPLEEANTAGPMANFCWEFFFEFENPYHVYFEHNMEFYENLEGSDSRDPRSQSFVDMQGYSDVDDSHFGFEFDVESVASPGLPNGTAVVPDHITGYTNLHGFGNADFYSVEEAATYGWYVENILPVDHNTGTAVMQFGTDHLRQCTVHFSTYDDGAPDRIPVTSFDLRLITLDGDDAEITNVVGTITVEPQRMVDITTAPIPNAQIAGKHHLAYIMDADFLYICLDGNIISAKPRNGIVGVIFNVLSIYNDGYMVDDVPSGVVKFAKIRVSNTARYNPPFTVPPIRSIQKDEATLALYEMKVQNTQTLVDSTGDHTLPQDDGSYTETEPSADPIYYTDW